MTEIPSTKPYLIRALYDWCVDAGYTPYLSVAVDDTVRVPRAFVRDGQIVLNIAPHATHQFNLDNEAMSCQARFGGVAHMLFVPIANITAIYAKENGQGMAFDLAVAQSGLSDEAASESSAQKDAPPHDNGPQPPQGGRGGHLRIVK